jgi:hypothetical protein
MNKLASVGRIKLRCSTIFAETGIKKMGQVAAFQHEVVFLWMATLA